MVGLEPAPVVVALAQVQQEAKRLLHNKQSLLPTMARLVAAVVAVVVAQAALMVRAAATPLVVAAVVADRVLALAALEELEQ